MKRYKQFDPLIIADFEVDEWKHPLHNHNHFELIFIAEGCGIHYLNSIKISYRKGDLFLLGPEDEHQFIVKKRTRFIYFKFTKLYITDQTDLPLPNYWNRDVDQLLNNPLRKKSNLLHDKDDRRLVCHLMQMIANEYQSEQMLRRKIIFQLFSVVTLITRRNDPGGYASLVPSGGAGIAEEILEYVGMNIYHPQKLTLKKLAEEFHYSRHYIGALFKQKVGSTLRDYVAQYRYRLVVQRLASGQDGVKRIASEFGFTDASHMYKFIKNNSGKNVSEIRKLLADKH